MRFLAMIVVLGFASCLRTGGPDPARPSMLAEFLPEGRYWGSPSEPCWSQRPPTFTTSRAGVFSGRIVADVTGKAISGADVWVTTSDGRVITRTTSRADGAFAFDVTEDASVIAVAASSWAFRVLSIKDLPVLSGVRIGLDKAGTIRGTIVDATGRGIPGGEVWVVSRRGQFPSAISRITTSNADGKFEIRDAPSGSVGVFAKAAGFSTSEVDVGGIADGKLVERVEVELSRGVVTGTIVDERGVGIPGASVVFLEEEKYAESADAYWLVSWGELPRTVSDSSGGFSLHTGGGAGWVVAGNAIVDGAVHVELAEGNRATVRIEARSFPRVRGRVEDIHGKPIAEVHVDREDRAPHGQFRTTSEQALEMRYELDVGCTHTDSAGRFDVPMYAPLKGNSAKMRTTFGRHIDKHVVRAEREDTIRLPDASQLSGRVFQGKRPFPASGIVELRRVASPPVTWIQSLSGGTFRCSDCESGKWTVRAVANGFTPGPEVTVEVSAAPVSVELQAGEVTRQRLIRGRLEGPSGAIDGARISINHGGYLQWNNAIRSQADGAFEIRVPEHTTELFIYHPEHQTILFELVPGFDDQGNATQLLPPTAPVERDIGTIQMKPGRGVSVFS